MKKLLALAAFGAGYVLGARAGRERYDQLVRGFTRVKEDPRVQEKAHQAAEVAKEQAHHVAEVTKEQAPVVKDRLGDLASSAVDKVYPTSSELPNP